MRQFKISERLTPRNTRSLNLYLTEVERSKMMDSETEAKIAVLAAKGDLRAREKLVVANLRFVLSVAKMYASRPEDFSDLVAAGNEGLIEASGKFDPSRGFKFISFAVWYIRKEMIKYLSENSRTIKVPTNQSQLLKNVYNTMGDLSALEGREITLDEALDHLKTNNPKYKGMDLKVVKKSLEADVRPASLDAELTHDSDAGTLKDLLTSEDFPSDQIILIENQKQSLTRLLGCLTDLERKIVIQHFGIDNQSGFNESLQTIAGNLDYTSEAIRVKIRKALVKMKKFSEKNKFYRDNV